LGGAALTRKYVEQDLRPLYKGPLAYANDAFDGLRFMEQLERGGPVRGIETGRPVDHAREEEKLTGSEAKIAMALEEDGSGNGSDVVGGAAVVGLQKSSVRTDVLIPSPPFWGPRIVEDIPLDDVFAYVNEVALIRGQWRVVRGSLTETQYQMVLRDQVYPELEALKLKIKNEKLLSPKLVYGYFPCRSEGNDLVIFDPEKWQQAQAVERLRFSFPRQKEGKHLCISDFFSSGDGGRMDVVAFHLVTVGRNASEYSKQLFESNNYKDYLYFHGLSVESAEALAELWHKRIREELGIAGKDASEIRKLFSQHYQGSRYSFGYPACPNLEDQAKLFELLRPGNIGVSLSDEFQLEPEQSTSAIIVHHPEARYFFVK
jgi:5-methyltetrahydrofolate--homocysteine methyltransferase